MRFSDLSSFRSTIETFPLQNKSCEEVAISRNASLTKPAGSLGRLEELAIWAAAWQGKNPPTLETPQITIFAGNHGVCQRGVSAFPPEVTIQMVENFKNGGAAINQLAAVFSAHFSVHPLDLDQPTADFTEAAAMSEDECIDAINTGWSAVNANSDCLVVGEMGIGNTTVAAALSAALYQGSGKDWAGPGTGVSEEGVTLKASVIDEGLLLHSAILEDPLQILRCLGGRELAAMAGAIAAAREHSIPVILDGFVATASAAILHSISKDALAHCISGHCSAEPGHKKLLQNIAKKPLLELGMRLGEGSGAALALGVLKGAIACHSGMASFAEAGVSDKD